MLISYSVWCDIKLKKIDSYALIHGVFLARIFNILVLSAMMFCSHIFVFLYFKFVAVISQYSWTVCVQQGTNRKTGNGGSDILFECQMLEEMIIRDSMWLCRDHDKR